MAELRDTGLRDTGARYEMDEQGLTSWADYRRAGDRLFIDHVESPAPLRGAGAAGRLMAALSADARAKNLRITPICGYAAAWLRRSKEFGDLVGLGHRGPETALPPVPFRNTCAKSGRKRVEPFGPHASGEF